MFLRSQMQLSTIKSINECISDKKFHEQIGKCEDWGRLKGSDINSLMLEIKKILPVGESNLGPPRDRRGYLPLRTLRVNQYFVGPVRKPFQNYRSGSFL